MIDAHGTQNVGKHKAVMFGPIRKRVIAENELKELWWMNYLQQNNYLWTQ